MDELDRELGAYADSLRPDRQPSLGDLVDAARDRRRRRTTTAAATVSVVALVGVVASALGGTEPNRPMPLPLATVAVTPSPTPIPERVYGCGNERIAGIVDYTNFVKANGVLLSSASTFGLDVVVRDNELGQATERVTCSLAKDSNSSQATEHLDNGTASFLPDGTVISEVAGFDPRCRVAAVQDLTLTAFLADLPGSTTHQPAPCAVMPRVPFDSTPKTAGDYRGAPAAYQQRAALPDCGSAATSNVVTPQLRNAVSCFRLARAGAHPAEFRTAIASDAINNGFIDIAYSVFRTSAGGPVELWQSGYTSGRGSAVYWRHQICTGVSDDGFGEGCVAG